jgi:hypothetical protein
MTYNTRFEQLLLISIQKSNVFLAIVKMEGPSGSAQYIRAQAEWDAAQKEYVSFLELMESSQMGPNDRITPIRTAFRARLRNISAMFFVLGNGIKGRLGHRSYFSRLAS